MPIAIAKQSNTNQNDKNIYRIANSDHLNVTSQSVQTLAPLLSKTDEGKRSIRFGLSAIKNVGDLAIDSFLVSRKKYGKFNSIEEMCREGDMSGINRKNLESLIKSGSMDKFGNRGSLLDSTDRILSLAQSEIKLKNSNQSSMFDLFGESVSVPLSKIDLPLSTISDHEQLLWEVEMLGISLSSIISSNRLYL